MALIPSIKDMCDEPIKIDEKKRIIKVPNKENKTIKRFFFKLILVLVSSIWGYLNIYNVRQIEKIKQKCYKLFDFVYNV